MNEYALAILQRAGHHDYFVELVEAAERGDAFTITRDGAPIAVVIGIDEYEQLRAAATMYEAR